MSRTGRVFFEGKIYSEADKMPPDVRERFEKARSQLPDTDNNGVPDLYEAGDMVVESGAPVISMREKAKRAAAPARRAATLAGIGLVAAILGFIALIFFGIGALMKSSGAYRLAVDTALASPEVQQELGTPIREGWFVMGEISESGSSGEADLTIPLYGSLKSGTLNMSAVKNGSTWRLVYLQLDVDGRSVRILP